MYGLDVSTKMSYSGLRTKTTVRLSVEVVLYCGHMTLPTITILIGNEILPHVANIVNLVTDLPFINWKLSQDPLILPHQITFRAFRSFKHHIQLDWMIQDT
jgi:hypothetical protein